MTWDGIERRSWISRLCDNENMVLLIIALILMVGGICGMAVILGGW